MAGRALPSEDGPVAVVFDREATAALVGREPPHSVERSGEPMGANRAPRAVGTHACGGSAPDMPERAAPSKRGHGVLVSFGEALAAALGRRRLHHLDGEACRGVTAAATLGTPRTLDDGAGNGVPF